MHKSNYLIGAVVAVVIAALVLQYVGTQPPAPQEERPQSDAPTAQRAAEGTTGSVDDAAATILDDIASDEVPAAESDPAILAEDAEALTGAGKSITSGAQ